MGSFGIGGSGRSERASSQRSSSAAPESSAGADWPVQATQQIVKVVDTVRDATTGRALTAARFLVYGTVLGLLAVPLAIVLLVLVMRLSEHALVKIGERFHWAWMGDPIWMVYIFFGAAILIAGLYSWRSANKSNPATP